MEAFTTMTMICCMMHIIAFSEATTPKIHHNTDAQTFEPDIDAAGFSELVLCLEELIHEGEFDIVPATSLARAQICGKHGIRERDRQRLGKIALSLLKDGKKLARIVHQHSRAKQTSLGGSINSLKYKLKYKLKYRREISALNKGMTSVSRSLDGAFLSQLCSSERAASMQRTEGFNQLGETIQTFIKRWANNNREIEILTRAGNDPCKRVLLRLWDNVYVDIFV
ncbi:hypothetical protein F5Y15DRAFT_393511 [Xylariaceae sp. FL0016]|nr:hypothetical protein F5Y15DRAFT_393511 [Xylariaceae sp. FL0016]